MKKFELNGVIKEVPTGFSWTVFFFGLFVPMFRGDAKWSVICLVVWLFGLFMFGIPGLILQVYLAFKYNEIHMNDLREKGYKELRPLYETQEEKRKEDLINN